MGKQKPRSVQCSMFKWNFGLHHFISITSFPLFSFKTSEFISNNINMLGITTSATLFWKAQVINSAKFASQKLGLLSKHFNYLSCDLVSFSFTFSEVLFTPVWITACTFRTALPPPLQKPQWNEKPFISLILETSPIFNHFYPFFVMLLSFPYFTGIDLKNTATKAGTCIWLATSVVSM